MSEEYPNQGTVRRRPRPSHQQSHGQNRNGHASANGAHKEAGPSSRSRFRNGRPPEDDEEFEPEMPRSRRRHERRPWEEAEPRRALSYPGDDADPDEGFKFPFDPWRLYGAVKRNSALIIAGGLIVALVGFAVAAFLVQYRVTVPLMRKTSNAFRSDGADQIALREYTDQTVFSFMKSGEVLRRVSVDAANNPLLAGLNITPKLLSEAVEVKASPNPDFALLQVKAFGELPAMVELANVYADHVVDYTVEIQKKDSEEINKYLQGKLAEADARIQTLNEDLRTFSQNGFLDLDTERTADIKQLFELQARRDSKQIELDTIDTRIRIREEQLARQTPQNTELQKAEGELRTMLLSMTEIHPTVQAKKREIEAIKQQQATTPAGEPGAMEFGSNPIYTQVLDLQSEKPALEKQINDLGLAITNLQQRLGARVEDDVQYAMKKTDLASQKTARDLLQARQRQAQLITENALGYFSVYSPATIDSVNYKSRWLKVALLSIAAGLAGLVASLFLVMLTEAMDTTLKTPEDVARVTGLPILATLGDLRKMSAAAQVNWAFKTLTHLRGKLISDADQALVCGITSSRHGEGRSTWVNLLVSAASQRGLRVLTVDTRPNAAAPQTAPAAKAGKTETNTERPPEPAAHSDTVPPEPENTEGINLPAQVDTTLTPNALLAPEKVADQLSEPGSQPVVHIPLPGWVWNLERRKQWQKALEYWREIDNLVIFVELPPASEPEAVLLAEHLPQVMWLAASGSSDATETAGQIDTLRHARVNLVGAVVNQAPPPVLNARIARWFTKITAALTLLGSLSMVEPIYAQTEGQDAIRPAERQYALSAGTQRKRAAWQEKLTFGPGDVMDIQFYGNPSLTRTNVMVGPDGRISYLQAQELVASGLTVDELRQKLDDELTAFYTSPRTIVSPVSFSSKKYFMLGRVNAKGAYVLDRPLTVVEAVARAKGLETGLYQRTSVEMADLGRSFLVRDGAKLPLDFRKLFLEGDLSQNVLIEPNDYLYFASAAANDIYVLGEVMNPGPVGFLPEATVVTAIADRGGYGEKAYKGKVLVIRGSLAEPETFVVDTEGVLRARTTDFQLQPRDIVYVSRRPWSKAEELLDEAASSFIQGAVTTWSGVNVGPIIKSRLLPRARSSD